MSRNPYLHHVAFALDHPWALTPGMLAVVAGILAAHAAGIDADPAVVAAAVAKRKPDLPQPARGGIAVIPVHGVIAPRANLLTETSGGTSFDAIGRALTKAAADPAVTTIVLDVDSPGGSVAGATEAAATLRKIRVTKPVIASVNFQGASAAYWLAAQATKVYAAPSAMVGSIGVYTMHDDLSDALAKFGIKRQYIAAGKFKVEGAETGPLSADALDYRQEIVSHTYDRFVADVAKGRGVPAGTVRNGFGEGRLVSADDALTLAMIDHIEPIGDTLARLLGSSGTAADVAALQSADTSQERPVTAATDQDRPADVAWQARMERDLLALSLSL